MLSSINSSQQRETNNSNNHLYDLTHFSHLVEWYCNHFCIKIWLVLSSLTPKIYFSLEKIWRVTKTPKSELIAPPPLHCSQKRVVVAIIYRASTSNPPLGLHSCSQLFCIHAKWRFLLFVLWTIFVFTFACTSHRGEFSVVTLLVRFSNRWWRFLL